MREFLYGFLFRFHYVHYAHDMTLACVSDSSLLLIFFFPHKMNIRRFIATERSSLSSVLNYHPSCGVCVNEFQTKETCISVCVIF